MFTYQVRDLTNFNACVHGFQCRINRLKWGGTICPFCKRPSFALQKTANRALKGHLLQVKRRPFVKAYITY